MESWLHSHSVPLTLGKSTPPSPPHHAPLTARASPEARGQPAVASMSCNFCVCFNWLSDGFSCVAPTVLLVHSSTSLCRSSVKVPFLLLLLFTCAWMCRAGWGPGSGPGTRLLVEDPREHTQARLVTPPASTTGRLQSFKQWSCLSQATPCFRRWSAFGGPCSFRHSGVISGCRALPGSHYPSQQSGVRIPTAGSFTQYPLCAHTTQDHQTSVGGSSENCWYSWTQTRGKVLWLLHSKF